MKRTLASLLTLAMASGALAEVQEQAHYRLDGPPDGAAPDVLHDGSSKSPELTRHGSPKTISDVPDCRRDVYGASMYFDEANQCYNVAKNLVQGDNFVVEVWARASRENHEGWHAVLANGNGLSGFVIAQHNDQWAVLVGGVGVENLGEVEAEQWTHLAIVKSQGAVTGWLNGRRVGNVPNLGGGVENFSIGATSPGREAFHGCVAEVRCATFQPGKFDSARDFLGNPKPRRRPIVPIGPEPPAAARTLQTEHATFGFDDKGFLLSITSRQTGKQYCPGKHPSPVMSLHENGKPNEALVLPVGAKFQKDTIELKYANGATAVVKYAAKDAYLRFELESLEPRGDVDNIVWGPLRTKIAGRIGDLLGVVRDDDWALASMASTTTRSLAPWWTAIPTRWVTTFIPLIRRFRCRASTRRGSSSTSGEMAETTWHISRTLKSIFNTSAAPAPSWSRSLVRRLRITREIAAVVHVYMVFARRRISAISPTQARQRPAAWGRLHRLVRRALCLPGRPGSGHARKNHAGRKVAVRY